MYLSTLKSYVEAIGGQLELIVRLPSRPPLRMERLGDVVSNGSARSGGDAKATAHPPARKAARAG